MRWPWHAYRKNVWTDFYGHHYSLFMTCNTTFHICPKAPFWGTLIRASERHQKATLSNFTKRYIRWRSMEPSSTCVKENTNKSPSLYCGQFRYPTKLTQLSESNSERLTSKKWHITSYNHCSSGVKITITSLPSPARRYVLKTIQQSILHEEDEKSFYPLLVKWP